MSVPTQVVKLVDQFRDQLQAVKSPQYKEAWVRTSYLDPFFIALGWDVHQENSGTLIHKEVVHEDSLKVEGAMKAPDYCFYNGGVRKFFVEAKKPSVNLFDGKAAAFQVRRYAWSAKLPLSVLTDFEELAIYDCRVRPQKEDKASTARSLYMTYEEYPDRWDEVASLFSKEAVLSGSLDAYVQEPGKKKGVAPVDQEFLKEMEGWREILAKDLAKRNPSLKRRELNYAVQMTIDRIVFLRICEDRGIEAYGNLEALVGKDNVYDNLRDAFKDADDKYNSGLFHFHEEKGREELPDDLTLKLQLSDQPLKKIIKGLYYPESPYQFSVMPVEIMGQVYEQFLGKVISVTPDHRVVIEEKPEVKKAGGIYYTPSYIVDYIVENTVGKLLEGKTPTQVSKLKVLDPACGSGSFLIGAYTYLLEWHRRWYVNDGPDKHSKVLYKGPSGEWQLTTAEKKRILLGNVHGVDIDSQAVEVTKLSLLLKVLEGETNESINSQLTFFNERALPDLDNNIKWGNSLIKPDFYNNEQMMLLDEDAHYRINVFDWEAAFPAIFDKRNPGFDVVLGNPPYVLLQSLNLASVFEYLSSAYAAAQYKIDTYQVFMERALQLSKSGGVVGLITPNTFLANKHSMDLRRILLENAKVLRLHLQDYNVFSGASVDTVMVVLNKTDGSKGNHQVAVYRSNSITNVEFVGQKAQSDWAKHDDLHFDLPGGQEAQFILERMDNCATRLGDFATAYFGIQTHDRNKYVREFPSGPNWKPALDGGNIGRYRLEDPVEFVRMEPSAIKSGGKLTVYEQNRIGVRQIGKRPIATLLPKGWYSLNTIYNIFFTRSVEYELKYVLGLLSSNLLGWYWELRYFDQKKTFPKVKKAPLLALPIPTMDFSDTEDVARHNRMVELVQRMLSLHENLRAARISQEKTFIQNQINATDHQIDRLVYELYGLSEEEIKIVEREDR